MKKLPSPFRAAAALPAVTVALMAAGLVSSAHAAIQTAGVLLVDVDATSLPAGPLTSIANAGTMGGVFEAGGSTPTIALAYGSGTKGIQFDGGGFMQHRLSVGGALISAEAGLTGVNPTASVEVWALNPAIAAEETMVSWGHRGGPDGSNMAFNYGYDARWGAVGHWGGADIGWDSCCNSTAGSPPGVPAAGCWHHLVYTFDGTTQRIYIDGVLKNSENTSLNTHPAPAITIGGQLTDDASTVEGGVRGSMLIGKIRIHQEAMNAAQVANNYNDEVASFTGAAAFVPVAPQHRYRFANPSGGAPDGSVVTDSIGTAHGAVRGAGATFTGSRVTIPGGSSATQGYIDLPNGLLSVNSADAPALGSGQLTLEGWTKVTALQTWARVLDIGSSVPAEVFGAGGGGEGRDYLAYQGCVNNDPNAHQFELRNEDAVGGAGGGGGTSDSSPNFQRDYHFAITWNEAAGTLALYENGNQVLGMGANGMRMSSINDVNVWLGRSNWSGDQNMAGEFDEFRIYNRVLTPEELGRSMGAGPAQMHLPGQVPGYDTQPLNVTVLELQSATFTVETSGAMPMTYQWFKGADPIPGATGLSVTLVTAVTDNGSLIKCVAQNAFGTTDSAVATLTVLGDTTPPALVGAAGGTAWGTTENLFGVRFTEPVNTADAQNVANYSLPGYTVLGPGVLQPDNVTVVFGVTPSLKTPICKTLSVSNVRDRAPSQNMIGANSQTPVIYAEGTIRYHRYNSGGFPDNPSVVANPPLIENPEGGGDHGDNYQAQGLTLLSPPVTGAYRFFIASDDGSQLYLSTDENPANKVQIAREPVWANFREFVGNAPGQGGRSVCVDEGGTLLCENVSGFINLTAGCRYYLEFVLAEGGGGDYCSVAWQTPAGGPSPTRPGNGSAPIGAQYISPYQFAPSIVATSPADQTRNEGERATLTVSLSAGSPILSYQWYSNNVAVAGATGPSHQTPSLRFPDNHLDKYHVVVQNSLGLDTSRMATLTVIDDFTKPTLVRGEGSPTFDRFTLKFSEVMDEGTAEDTFNYTISGGLTVNSAVLEADGMTVTLLVDPQAENTPYTIEVAEVTDFAGNKIDPSPTNVVVRSWVAGCGGLVFETYAAAGGTAVSLLTSHPSFPNSPDSRRVLTTFDTIAQLGTSDFRNDYGARVRGFFQPPASGNYVFYLHSDDASQLFLNPSGPDPAGKVMIAEELGCCRDWPTIASAPIPLMSGQVYYIEGLYKEGGGGDYIRVAARIQGSAAPLAAISLTELGQIAPPDILGPLTISTQPISQTVLQNSSVSFSVAASVGLNIPGLIFYQWERSNDGGGNWNEIMGATGQSYAIPQALLTDDGAKFRAKVCGVGINARSDVATLTVMPDNVPPTVTRSLPGPALDRFTIQFSEFMDEGSVEDTFNYTIGGGGPSEAILEADRKTVTLLFGPQIPNTVHVIEFSAGLTDLIGNPLVAVSLPVRSCVAACAGVRFEAFDTASTPGNAVSLLTSHPNFPNNPRDVATIQAFDSRSPGAYPDNSHEQYGGRMRGIFFPPVTADWVFHLGSDDASDLYFNPTGPTPAGKILIQQEPGCCGLWTDRTSAAFPLIAGEGYYIEGLWKEGGGGDYLKVAARLATNAPPVDDPEALGVSPSSLSVALMGALAPSGAGGPITFSLHPAPQTVGENTSVTFTVAGAPGQDFLPLCYQWQRAGVDIPGANGPIYTRNPVPLADDGVAFSCVLSTIGTFSNSANAVLSVTPDTTPPTLASLRVNSATTLEVVFSEPMDAGTAADEFNYELSGPDGIIPVNDATLLPNPRRVLLTIAARVPCGLLTLTVSGLTDVAVALNPIATNSQVSVLHIVPRGLAHRYTFNNPAAGDAGAALIGDVVGTADGDVKGAGSSFSGSRLAINGGASATAAYVDLPNGLLSANAALNSGSGEVTLEGWVKVTGARSWARIFDIGSSDLGGGIFGEVPGPGGGGEGRDYLMLSASINGLDTSIRRTELRNEDPAGGGSFTVDHATTGFNQDTHFAMTWNETTGVIRTYENGVQVSTGTVSPIRISDIHDVNVWLGRSNWNGDENMQGEFDEFRIHSRVLSPADLATSGTLGPDAVYGPVTAVQLAGSLTVQTLDAQQLGASADFSNVSGIDLTGTECLRYQSSDLSVLSVSPFGVVTAVNCGVASITAHVAGVPGVQAGITITVTNCSPIARDDGGATRMGHAMVIAHAKLLRNDSDNEGAILTVVGVSATSTNGSVVLGVDDVTYTPQPGFSGLDRFTYTVSDGRSTDTGEVQIFVVDGAVPSQNQVALIMTPNGFLIRFAGIPGRTYEIQRATTVTGPWSTLVSLMAPLHGIMEFEDTNPPQPNAFYRTVVP